VDISVIIPTLNRDTYLKDSLGGLLQQEGNFSFEIIVVDQNAVGVKIRNSSLYLLSQSPRVKWFGSAGKHVTYARNKGISLAEGEIIVFVDDDVKIDDKKFLQKHLNAHRQSDSNVAAVCGREVNENSLPHIDSLDYERKSPLSDVFFFPRNYSKRTEAVVLSTANCSINKKALLDVKGFDENFSGAAFCEDIDLALRLINKEYEIVYDPSPTLLHLKAPTGGLGLSDNSSPFSHTERALSAIVFYLKYIHKSHREFRRYYIYWHILRKTVLLKANVSRPWRLPLAAFGLIRAFFIAHRLLKKGHRYSF